MTVAPVEAPEAYRIARSWRGCDATVTSENSVTLTPIPDRTAGVLATDEQFLPNVMTLAEAHKKSEQLNKIQIASGYLDWLYYPVPDGSEPVGGITLTEFDYIVANY